MSRNMSTKRRRSVGGLTLPSSKPAFPIDLNGNDLEVDEQPEKRLKLEPKPFLDLPPEIRNRIYTHLSIINRAIITSRGDAITQLDVLIQGNRLKLRWSLQLPHHHGGKLFTYAHEPRLHPPGFNPAFFRVCKQIHQEARHVFYGANNFRVSSTATLRTFLDAIGANRGFLRAVEIVGDGFAYSSKTAPECAWMLREAEELRSLHLDVGCRGYDLRPVQMARDLAPLIERLFVSRGADFDKVWEVVTFGKDLEEEMVDVSGAKEVGVDTGMGQAAFADVLRREIELLSVREGWMGGGMGEGAKQVDHSEQAGEEME